MKLFRYIFIHTSLWLALGASGIALMTFVVLNAPLILEVLLIPFLYTFFGYNLNKKTDIDEDSINYPERVNFIKKYGTFLFTLGILGYLIALILSLSNSLISFFITLSTFILVFLYSVVRFKKFFIIKDIVVPLGWSITPLLVISFIYFDPIFLIVPFFIFSRSLIITIFYDVKDVKGDELGGIKTIPTMYGEAFTKKLLYLLNILSFSVIFILSILVNLYLLIPFAFITFIYSIFYISFMKKLTVKKLGEIFSAGEYILIGLSAYIIWVFIWA